MTSPDPRGTEHLDTGHPVVFAPPSGLPASPTPGSSPDSTLCDALTDTITRATEAGRDPRGIAHAILPIVLAEIAGRDEEIARLTAGLEDLRYIEEITRLSPDDDPPADPEQFGVAWAELMRSWKWATTMARRFTGHYEAAAKRARQAEAERDQALAQRDAVIREVLVICDSEYLFRLGRVEMADWVRAAINRALGDQASDALAALDQPTEEM